MANASVQYLLAKIDAFLTGELRLPRTVKHGIRTLKSELESITAFLKERHQRADQDDQILVYVRRVQDVAYDIDNVLDLFSYHHSEKRRTIVFTKWWVMHSIEAEINQIKSSLKNINETNERYQRTSSALQASRNTHSDLHTRIAPLYLADADVSGFEEDRDMLTAWA